MSGIRYVEIGSSDLARSLDFYQDLLGFRPAGEVTGAGSQTARWLEAGPALVKLVHVGAGDLGAFTFTAPKIPNPWTPDGPRLGLRHIGIGVADPDEAVRQLAEAGAHQLPGEVGDGDGGGRLLTDGDGIPLRAVPAR